MKMEKTSNYTVPDLSSLRKELREHFGHQWELNGQRHPVEVLLDVYDKEHPGQNAYQLKAAQYKILSENMETVIFDNSPFYYVNDLCRGPQAGFPFYSAGGWLLRRNEHLAWDANPEDHARYEGMKDMLLFTGSHLYFDVMHYCYPVRNVVEHGLKYYYNKAKDALETCGTQEERDFIQCAMTGLMAAKHVSERFGRAAAERLQYVTDPTQKKFMKMIAETAARVPWEKPQHFYEGLNTLWFCRNLLGELDGVGNSHLGRPDLLLNEMYEKDIASGYMTREEAYDLISRFLVHGDCEYDKNFTVLNQNDHELEMGYVLGGCDNQGKDVYNEITDMFIHAHRTQKLIYPKPHYRFGKDSTDDYINSIAEDYVHGRSIGGMVNDDSIIPVLVDAGKSLEDAREYINYGCWGIVVEGMENVTGGNFVHMLSVMERTIYGDNDICKSIGVHFNPLDKAASFDEVYNIYYDNLIRVLRDRLQLVGKYGNLAKQINPIPLFSAFVDGCLESRCDCLAGGSKYNSNNFSLAELSNVVDALLAIKSLCFDKKVISLQKFLDIVRSNWEGHEDLRQSLHNCPHYGDESSESMGLTKRLFDSIYRDTRDIKNEFGTSYMIDLFVYQEFRFAAEQMKATPDGRKDGDIVALGANPARFHYDSIPAVLNSITAIDPMLAETHSLTLQLPAAKMTVERMNAIIRAVQKLNMKHLQINCVDVNTLLDAQKHPEEHQDLVVRICGFSAKFVSLSPEWQDEFIHRVMYSE